MSESRTELLAWYNDLSQDQYSKVEQFGTGAAHCLIMDSIFRDVPLSKVKFQAKHEWEYVANFKILQSVFDKHKIDNAIPVERLIKCKFQDNLEFLQWIKKFWDQYYPGGEYNRKKKVPLEKVKPVRSARAAAAAGPHVVDEYQKVAAELTTQLSDLKLSVDQVEKEREFYFGKLREIEVYIQQQLEDGVTPQVDKAFKDIQAIMYKVIVIDETEEGFEAPEIDA
jgi:RP/EB family microtubule-associated protein